jgi:serine/threonine-protein kinase
MEKTVLGNRYEIIEKIGEGGMAIVYKAKCNLLNRYVALKVLRPEFTEDQEFLKRFADEARSVAKLSHPNIVPIYDIGSENKINYIVMEYAEGPTLKEYLREHGRMNWKEAVNIAAQVAGALDHAHKNGIIHRDIKPQNIIITKGDVAKVTDFGIAKFVSGATITIRDKVVGSVQYFSPEQARGSICDAKSDIYSLGIVLYELLTNTLPFDAESPVAIAIKQIQEEPIPVIEIFKDIPVGVNDIVLKAMKKNPQERYQSAALMKDDLTLVLKQPYAQFLKDKKTTGSNERTIRMDTISIGGGVVANSRPPARPNSRNADDDRMRERKKVREAKRKQKVWTYVTLGAILFIILAVVVVLITTAKNPVTDGNQFIMKNYVGRPISEAKTELTGQGIFVATKEEYSDTIAKDIIIDQNVTEGTALTKNDYAPVTFTVSLGSNKTGIPDIKGMSVIEATNLLKSKGFVVTQADDYSNDVAKGLAFRTDPAANSNLAVGSTVILYVSQGVPLYTSTVPELEGLKISEVQKVLADRKLTLGKVYVGPTSAGMQTSNLTTTVTGQKPLPTTVINEMGAVDIYMSDYFENGRLVKYAKYTLGNNQSYGSSVRLVIKAKYSDTGEEEIIKDIQVDPNNLSPYYFQIYVPQGGSTQYSISINDGVVEQGTKN